MCVRIHRMFPEHPLTERDYPGGTLRASFDWSRPPERGWVRFTDRPHELIPPQERDLATSLHVAEVEGEVVGLLYALSNHKVLCVTVLEAEGKVRESLVRHAVAEAGERPLFGYAPDTPANRLALQRLGLNVLEGVRSEPGGTGWCLFYTFLPAEDGPPEGRTTWFVIRQRSGRAAARSAAPACAPRTLPGACRR